jgi:hypothetical protein
MDSVMGRGPALGQRKSYEGRSHARSTSQIKLVAHRVGRWKWGQEREYTFGLMRPEITHSLLKITAELAEILGIALDEGK